MKKAKLTDGRSTLTKDFAFGFVGKWNVICVFIIQSAFAILFIYEQKKHSGYLQFFFLVKYTSQLKLKCSGFIIFQQV